MMLRCFSRNGREQEESVLRGMAAGATLKAHRYLDGRKVYRMYPLAGVSFAVAEGTVAALKRKGYIDSNMKFPAATYQLTGRGRQVLSRLQA